MHSRCPRIALVVALLLLGSGGASQAAGHPERLTILPAGSYRLTPSPMWVRRLSDGAWLPNSPNSRAWAEYQAWLKAGNTPLPAAPAGKP